MRSRTASGSRLAVLGALVGLFMTDSARATVPLQLLAPINNSQVIGAGYVQLDWTDACAVVAVPGLDPSQACWYAVQIASDSSFSQQSVVVSDFTPAVISRFVVASALDYGTWYWRVGTVRAFRPRNSQSLAIKYGAVGQFDVLPPATNFSVSPTSSLHEIIDTVAEAVAASSAGPVRVEFPPFAQYRLDVGTANVFLNLTNAQNVVIDGQGSSFVFVDGFLTFVWAVSARSCTVMNLTVDFDPLPYTALRVLSHAGQGASRSLLTELAPGHPTIESNSKVAAYGIAEILNGTTRAVQRGAGLVLPFQWMRVPGTPPRYNLSITTSDPKVWAVAGDVIAIDARIDIGFGIYGSDQITLADLTVRAMANEGFTSSYTSGLAILNCNLELLPGRYLVANNGGHNHHSSRVGVWLDGGSWANTGDDFFNANCLMADVAGVINSTALLVKPSRYDPHGLNTSDIDMQVGDQLEIFYFANGTILVNSTIIGVQTGLGENSASLMTAVTVSEELPFGLATATGLQVYNRQRTASQMVVRNVELTNARRVGVLAHGVRGWVSDNRFSMLGGGLFEAWPDPAEGLGVESYVIESNLALHTNQLDRWSAPIWITSFSKNASRVHRDVWVLNNTIIQGPGPTAVVRDINSLQFDSNSLTLCQSQTSPISINFSSSVQFSTSNTVLRSTDPAVCYKPTGPASVV